MADQPKPTVGRILRNPNFRLLWIGQGTSLLGDQFFLIALPWLVLKLTNDPLALGTVLALAGIPRALFMLVGGAATDRYSPRIIMLASDIVRLLLATLLTILILVGSPELWMIYLLALSFGVISGFFNPASSAMMPMLINSEELPTGNSIYQGTAQLINFLGPMLAGGLIALFAHANAASGASEMTGIAVAMAVDAFTFLVSVATLLAMRLNWAPDRQAAPQSSIIASIGEGIRYVWRQPMLRMLFILIVAANFLFVGPVLVGIPVLADTRLAEGAAAYGTIMGAYGGGNLLGILLTSAIVRTLNKRLGQFMVAVIAAFGVGLGLLGVVTSTPIAFVILLVIGVGNGVLGITGITFLQSQTPKELLGRIMSLILLATVGLVPISQALTGVLIKMSLGGLFAGAGILMLLVALWLAFQPEIRTFGRALSADAKGYSYGHA